MGLLLLPVVAVVAVAALAVGVPARKVVAAAGAATAGLLVLSLAVGILMVGFEDDEESTPARAGARLQPVDAVLAAEDQGAFLAPVPPLDEVESGDAVLLEVELSESATAHLCSSDAVRPSRCGLGIPVEEPADGAARFLFELTPRAGVDCERDACAVRLFDADGDVVASLPVVFGRAVSQPAVSVRGSQPFADGEAIDVELEGFTPGERVVVAQCVPPGPSDAHACGGPAPEVAVTVGAGGSARLGLPAHIGAVGDGQGECRRGRPCAVGVLGASVVAPVAELSLAGTAGAEVPGRRVGAGLGIVVTALAVAALLVRRTDWTPVGGDPFAGIVLSVPPGWEDLRHIADDDDLAGW